MFLLKYIILIFLFISLYCQLNKSNKIKVNLNIALFFLIALFIYIVEPLFEVLINNEINRYNEQFINEAIIATFCLLLGTFISQITKNITNLNSNEIYNTYKYKNYSKFSELVRVIIASAICIIFIMVNIVINRGGIHNFFSTSYSNVRYMDANNNIAALIFATIAYAIVFNNNNIIKFKVARYIAHIMSFLFIVILLLGGNRNYAIMILFAFIFVLFKDKKFNIIYVSICILLGIVLMGILAVFREYGILNIINNKVVLNIDNVLAYAFNFRNGELGTTMNFSKYEHVVNQDFKFPYAFGYSYFILPIINLIPRSLWAGKPLSYSDYFSRYAFNNSEGIGFGFSPIYEAKINFGFGWGIIFILFGFLIMRLNMNASKNKVSIKTQLLCGIISSVILNFFRIDFTTIFKFIIMIWIFAMIFLKIATNKVKINNYEYEKNET